MARNQEVVSCKKVQGWTELTNADVTEITFQATDVAIHVLATVGSVEPTKKSGYVYEPNQGERSLALSKMSNEAVTRVWAKPIRGTAANVLVDHA